VPTYSTESLTLRAVKIREHDRVLTLLTRERGKVSAVAKGIGRPQSKLTPCTELLAHCRLTLAEGKNLEVVTQVEVVDSFTGLRNDVYRLACAAYCAELVERTVESGQHAEAIYGLLLAAVRTISDGPDPELATRAFELRLLGSLGLAPRFSACARCGADELGPRPVFVPATGGAVCTSCAGGLDGGTRVTLGTLKTLEAVATVGWQMLGRLKPNAQTRAEMRRAIMQYIAYHLDVRLKTLEFLMQIEAARKRAQWA
jgi:DNA repair protein RecO (recombination protein O)